MNPEVSAGPAGSDPEDSMLRRLTVAERLRFAQDAWEPSLLRKMIGAERPDLLGEGRRDES